MTEELAPRVLLEAYATGIFPMSDPWGRIGWYSPDPRAVIDLEEFTTPRTLRQVYRQKRFDITVNRDFAGVIRGCADREEGTWISENIVEAYSMLHELGHAHSVECHRDGQLAGGLYGVSLGGAFFGESMFTRVRDASKVALVFLVERLSQRGYKLLDVQYVTPHLARFGAKEIPRNEYWVRLKAALKHRCQFED